VIRSSRSAFLLRVARRRLSTHLWPIVQTALAAVSAWGIASLLGIEQRPVFASIAAVIALGATFGERGRKAVELVGGVVLGIAVADVLVHTLGTGLAQVGLLVLLAMTAAVVLGGGELLISEAAVSAVLIASLPTSAAGTRLVEALIGGGVALAVHALVFPPDPVLPVARATNLLFGRLGLALSTAAAALEARDPGGGEQALRAAQEADRHLRTLERELELGEETATWAPSRRGARRELHRYARPVPRLELTIRETRLLGRDVTRFVRRGGSVPDEFADATRDLARAVWELSAQFDEPWRSGDVHVLALGAANRTAATAESLRDGTVLEIAGHIRSIAVDLVRASEAEAADDGGALADSPTEELVLPGPFPTAAEPPPEASPPARPRGQ
jgi:uncharacterized membrane protein YgaE (UPF0421/DUF939 family)